MEGYLKYFKDKKVLITGGAGAIGSNLSKTISDLDAKLVIIQDDLSASYEWNIPSRKNVMFVKGSVTDDIALKRIFAEEPEYVFHLAAFFANQNSVDYPEKDIMVNGLGILKVLEFSNFCKVKKFIYASSGCSIYGSQAPLPLKEEFMSMELSTPYQITKMLGELYCNFFWHHYGLKVVKTRFFNSYGPGEVPGQYRNVIPNFIYWAMKGLPLPITGTGEETRDFTYVDDLVDGMLRASYFEKAVGEAINLASSRETKIMDLANMINKLTGNKESIKFLKRRKWDTKNRLLASTEKAKKIVGYKPKITFEKGIRRTIKWFENNWDKIDEYVKFGPGISSAVRNYFNK